MASDLRPSPFLKDFTIKEKLGQGGYSVVYRAINNTTQEVVALKVIQKLPGAESDAATAEFKIQQRFDCPYIVNIYDMVEEADRFLPVIEYVSGGELFDAVVNDGPFSEHDAARLVQQMLIGLKVLHDSHVVHRDLKPENVLLGKSATGDLTVKLSDFGLAGIFSGDKLKSYCGTVAYAAPEIIRNIPYDPSIDIWSLGCIVFVLLSGGQPFYDPDEYETAQLILMGELDFDTEEWDAVSDLGKAFVKRMIQVNPQKRISIEDALNHSWITGNAPNVKLDDLHKHLKIWNVKRKLKRVADMSMAAQRLARLAELGDS
jgi:serine/threonine protein kinase